MTETDLTPIAVQYKWFAANEATGQSPLYAELCQHIAEDQDVLRFLFALPQAKRQPNLLLASYRSLFGTPADWPTFRRQLLAQPRMVAKRMMDRATQTNEAGRCAVLLPLLAQLPQPLAIIEVGAAAGLCLLPDRYGYDYGDLQLMPEGPSDDVPIFPCRVSGHAPLPERLPNIAWRRGLDLNPLDVADTEQMNWLETLVWPGQEDRLARLKAAVSVTQRDPPLVVKGDLTCDLEELVQQVPAGMTKVIFHTAVLNYVRSQQACDAFADRAMALADYWISNEAPVVFPSFKPPEEPPRGMFLLSMNRQPMAWTNPHGASISWI